MIIKHWTLIIPQVTLGLLSIVDNVGILKSYLTSLSPILQSSALFGLKTLDKPTCIILHPGQGSSWALINHQKVPSQVSSLSFTLISVSTPYPLTGNFSNPNMTELRLQMKHIFIVLSERNHQQLNIKCSSKLTGLECIGHKLVRYWNTGSNTSSNYPN